MVNFTKALPFEGLSGLIAAVNPVKERDMGKWTKADTGGARGGEVGGSKDSGGGKQEIRDLLNRGGGTGTAPAYGLGGGTT